MTSYQCSVVSMDLSHTGKASGGNDSGPVSRLKNSTVTHAVICNAIQCLNRCVVVNYYCFNQQWLLCCCYGNGLSWYPATKADFVRFNLNKLCAWRHNIPPAHPLYACCSPPPVHSLHVIHLWCPAHFAPWIFMIDRQRLALGGSVETGHVDIHYVVTWTANQSGLVTLTFDPENGVRVMCDVGYLCANFGLYRPLCSRLRPNVRDRRQTDVRQTDVKQKHRLMPSPIRGGGIIKNQILILYVKYTHQVSLILEQFWWSYARKLQ